MFFDKWAVGGLVGVPLRAAVGAFSAFSLTMVIMSGPADAHRGRRPSQMSGVAIPNLTHGQLRVMSRYRSAILDLANKQVQPNLEVRRLQNFVSLQFAYCLWGLVPGSLAYEGSPFNECSHAYLAGAKTLLDRLRRTEDTRARAEALADEINAAMLASGAALDICSNSFEPFNTAEVIMPEWANVSFNPLGVLLAIVVFGAAGWAFASRGATRKTSAS